MKISKKENISLLQIKKQKIKIILNIPKNNECFECSNLYPEFISLNNAIFLCKNCVKNHNNFPKSISNIIKNDLNNLTLKNIQYLCCGGNEKLKQFIQNEFPKLKKFSYQNIYKTYAVDYYRKYLDYLIEGGIKPIKPNKNKAYELLKINNNLKKIKNNKDVNNKINNIEEPNLKNKKENSKFEKKNDLLRITKSSGRYRPNLNIILPNFNNSLNNFNTINIFNYNDKIYTETYNKKRFFSQIFRNDSIEEINEQTNLTEINNITFNKEDNNNLKVEYEKKDDKKRNSNIKMIKKKDFLDGQYINYQKNNIYEKPFFQNYVSTVNKGKRAKFLQKGYELSSSDLNYFSNDIRDITQNLNKSNTRNNLTAKNIRSSKKIFRKKTVGSSFSINYKNHGKTTTNSSKEKIDNNNNNNKQIFNLRNSNKNRIKSELIEEIEMFDSLEEKGKIKVNRQINKNRKRYSLSDIIIDNKYGDNEIIKERNKKKFDKIQKAKIIERIRRVTSNQKEKNNKNVEKYIKQDDSQLIENNKINNKNKDYKMNKKDKSSLLIKDMINKQSNIKRNILEIIKTNNLSNLIISPNTKKMSHISTEPKFITNKDLTKNIPINELYTKKMTYKGI